MKGMVRAAIVATHPIQYQVPVYRALSAIPGLDVIVYYALIPTAAVQGTGFGVAFEWDIPLLDGYRWERIPGVAREARLDSFWGLRAGSLLHTLKSRRPDVLLIPGWNSFALVQASIFGRMLGVPMVVRAESNAMRRRAAWKSAIHRAFLRNFECHIAIGTGSRDFYLAAGVGAERIFLAPYCVDNNRFSQSAAQRAQHRREFRARWKIPAEAIVFGYVGKLQPKKHILDLLSAALRARNEIPAMHVLVVGAGEEAQQAQAFALAHALPAVFTGFVNQADIASCYAAMDILVLPSDDGETWGLVVNEAMNCGVPAIVSDRVGCGPDLVLEGRTGLRFPFGDPDALAAAMRRLANDPGLLHRMSEECRKHVAQYSVEGAAGATAAALFRAAGHSAC